MGDWVRFRHARSESAERAFERSVSRVSAACALLAPLFNAEVLGGAASSRSMCPGTCSGILLTSEASPNRSSLSTVIYFMLVSYRLLGSLSKSKCGLGKLSVVVFLAWLRSASKASENEQWIPSKPPKCMDRPK